MVEARTIDVSGQLQLRIRPQPPTTQAAYHLSGSWCCWTFSVWWQLSRLVETRLNKSWLLPVSESDASRNLHLLMIFWNSTISGEAMAVP
jgi:hypothetical protein